MTHISIQTKRVLGTIDKNIFGHFAEHLGRCIYQGIFVGEGSCIPNENGMRKDVVQALRNIRVPVLRWPGGCFADEYHWRDGIGRQESRKRMVNTNWGYVVEDNSFGTHEFLELCRQVGCEPYINANLGSGTVREMSEWVEYLNSDGESSVVLERAQNGHKEPFGVKFLGVGNESWGCGGNMRPEYYADEFRRYNTFCRDYGERKLVRIACGPNTDDYRWTAVLMERAGRFMDALTLHYYTVPGDSWAHKGSATAFGQEAYYRTLRKALDMETLVTRHSQIMDQFDPEKRISLFVDEWGCWHDVEPGTHPGFLYQQNTMRDAVVAALTLNIFQQHCDRVRMANIAQMVNVLQAVILTEGEKMVLTPTYHVFDLYQAHQDACAVDCFVEGGAPAADGVAQLYASASTKDGRLTITVTNTSATEAAKAEIDVTDFAVKDVSARILTGAMDAYNDFDSSPLAVRPFTGAMLQGGVLALDLPACAVCEITCA